MTIKKIITSLLALGVALGVYATLIEPFRMNVTRWTVQTEKWTNRKELRIAVLSDIHMITPWMSLNRVANIVRATNELKPDLIVLTGDYVATHPFGLQINPDTGAAELAKLSAPCGIYAVIGNHDSQDGIAWPFAMIRAKIPFLQNRAEPLTCNGEPMWIAGLGDLWQQRTDSAKAVRFATDDAPIVMAMHMPDDFASMPDRVALTLAGHTHGGQVRLPFIGAIGAAIPSKYGDRYAYGHIVENGKHMVVSGGLGMSVLPVRFLATPEITLVTLRGK